MKKKLRKVLSVFGCLTLIYVHTSAQWCVPNTIIPYATTMPGITHVAVGDINRSSADLENYPANSYVNTGMSTDLVMGNTYTISITHTIDASICPDMNIRVWIDYNMDFSFDDAGETVILADHHAAGTYTGTFTVPPTAVPGMTRMRITAKMSNLGGHTLPTPCDFPPDPLGYHGEDEDYTVNLINATGVTSVNENSSTLSVYPTLIAGQAKITFSAVAATSLALFNVQGETVWSTKITSHPGMYELILDEKDLAGLKPGIYFVSAMSEESHEIKKVIIL